MQNCNYIHRFLVCVNIWAPIVYLGREICVRLPLLTICWLGLILLFYQINSWVLAEVDNFEKACETISSHTYPHFFNHVCFVSELYYFDLSRFPTLIAVALELEKGSRVEEGTYNRSCFKLINDNDDSSAISGENSRKVLELLKTWINTIL
jgi:hypothetical protein